MDAKYLSIIRPPSIDEKVYRNLTYLAFNPGSQDKEKPGILILSAAPSESSDELTVYWKLKQEPGISIIFRSAKLAKVVGSKSAAMISDYIQSSMHARVKWSPLF